MLRLRLGGRLTRHYKAEGLVYLPDFMIYTIDEREYKAFWHGIKSHPQNRLYTDGLQVYRVNWLQSLFQLFKGWLGFDNHCDPNKVEMTLAKIAYYGYLRGFHPVEFEEYAPSIISDRFKALISSERNNQNSAELQQLLMSYYLTHSPNFPALNQPILQAYPFGHTLVNEQLYTLVPSIDPQDAEIISQSIRGMYYQNTSAHSSDCFELSPFAEAYAAHLVGERRFNEALIWSERVKINFKEQFIVFYISQRYHDPEALQKAIELIALLFRSLNESEQSRAVNYIRQNFNIEEQLYYLQSHPELRAKVADAYLEEAKTEKNRFTITKFILGDKVIPLLAHAVRLEPHILDRDSSMQDILMKEEWTTYQFNEAIKDKRFHEAKELYKKHPHFKFDKNKLLELRNYFVSEIESKTASIKTALEKEDLHLAEKTALQLVIIAKLIARITPQDNPLLAVTVEYALTLFNIDKILHPEVKNADLKRLNKAQEVLNQLNLLNAFPASRSALNKVLLRKINCLIEKVRVPVTFDDSWELRSDFVKEHKAEIDALKNNLQTFIALNEKNRSKEFRPILGKMHYLLGDVIYYFTRNKQDALPHFEKASEVMSENPYYRLRYFEITEDERRHDVVNEIEEMGYLQHSKYRDWMTERWHDEQFMSEGMDIHNISAQDQGIFSSLTRMFA
ncbi:hypothetical protein [Legionella maioricensis]|uniref:Uncharacterized protein n=1 Tax=Legionella maioricensis TaxID=2896528 RepID=A0A9X2D2I1_9GAMM|nr:hypothetical protein [Legionella maioricensis]MCL9685271.1 hypothetical protein [Legionella maioricensis]MCL9688488.1 hypothetical protein [Legionella maioricensis]